MMSAATIRDVARHADVSIASVSRVINGAPNVHPDTRSRVAASVKALNFVPHAGARSLSTARNRAIGVMLPDLHGEFFSEVVRGLDREATAHGYHLLLSNIHADPDLAGAVLRSLRGRVDGLIVMAPQLEAERLAAALLDAVPTVLINGPGAPGRTTLAVDNRLGAATMVRHLVESGRRRIVHVTGDLANVDARERRDGYRDALGALPEHVIEGDFQEASGIGATRALLRSKTDFDAIFAANDMMALGALHVLREADIDVPAAVAVAGFDDIPLARYLGLTTMRVDMAGLGMRAVKRLIAQITGDANAAREALPTQLIVRKTTRDDQR